MSGRVRRKILSSALLAALALVLATQFELTASDAPSPENKYVAEGKRVLVCLRPEDITLGPANGQDFKSTPGNRLAATVTKITP
jgi:hypothetical protein